MTEPHDVEITSVEVSAYTIPTDRPEADGTISWSETTIVLAEVSAGGRTGIGWTYGPRACAELISSALADLVRGADALSPTLIQESLVRAMRNAGRPGIAGCAISALDIAVWDLKARLLSLPLDRLLGSMRAEIPVYGSGGFTTYPDAVLEQQLTDWVVRDRIPRVKIKIGESWGREPASDRRRIRLARRVIGEDAELYVDANGAYSVKAAIRLARDIEDASIAWLEEPVSSDDARGLAAVRSAVTADVAAGEYGYCLRDFHRLCSAGAVDCLQADVTRCGGITEWMRVASLAHAFGLELSGHCAPHAHAHVAAAVPNLRHLEWFHDHVRIERMLFDGTLDPNGGVLRLGGEPGHGLRVRRADVEGFRVA